jgi:hypothetical protein
MSTNNPGEQRLFSLTEANAIVERITPLLERLRDEHAALLNARQAFGEYANTLRNHGFLVEGHRVESEIGEHIARLREGIDAITDLGVEIKNLEWGLVDFPTLRNGEIVYLCWRLNEGPISYWHDLDSGFAGRQPIDDGFEV